MLSISLFWICVAGAEGQAVFCLFRLESTDFDVAVVGRRNTPYESIAEQSSMLRMDGGRVLRGKI